MYAGVGLDREMGMRLDQDFLDADRELLDEFASWLGENEVGTDATVADADVFTVWRRLHSTGVLDAFDEHDLVEFLLDWCPRKYVADPYHVCASVGAFLHFLAETGRLAGGAERAAQLARLATHLAPAMRAMDGPGGRAAKAVFKHPMANPPGKPSYAELLAQGAMSEEELEAELQSRFAEYYELPERERDALTARFMLRKTPSRPGMSHKRRSRSSCRSSTSRRRRPKSTLSRPGRRFCRRSTRCASTSANPASR
jgi:hypothetical protein